MANNKVVLGDETLIDLTEDTVTENSLLAGATAHNAAGEKIEGAVVVAPIDDALSETSTNPVQNKVVTQAISNKLESEVVTELSPEDIPDYPPTLDDLLNDIDTLKADKANNSVISDAWNISTTYTVGNYCIYDNSLWKCKVQHNGQIPTEGTYWTKVTVGNELGELNSNVSNLNSSLTQSIMVIEQIVVTMTINSNGQIDNQEYVVQSINNMKPVGIVGYRFTSSGWSDKIMLQYKISNGRIVYSIKNTASTNQSATVVFNVLYIRTGMTQ